MSKLILENNILKYKDNEPINTGFVEEATDTEEPRTEKPAILFFINTLEDDNREYWIFDSENERNNIYAQILDLLSS